MCQNDYEWFFKKSGTNCTLCFICDSMQAQSLCGLSFICACELLNDSNCMYRPRLHVNGKQETARNLSLNFCEVLDMQLDLCRPRNHQLDGRRVMTVHYSTSYYIVLLHSINSILTLRSVAFCPVAFCLSGLLSCGLLSGGLLSRGLLSGSLWSHQAVIRY